MKKKKYEEYEDYEDENETAPARRRFPVGLIVVILLFAALAFAAFQVLNLYKEVDGAGQHGTEITLTVQDGATAGSVAQLLADNGIVEHEWLFKLYAKYSGKASSLQPGDVTLQPGMAYNDILKAISVQRVFRKTVTLTFPEGSTAVQIAQKLEEKGLCNAAQFLACANGESYTENDGTTQTADFSAYSFWTQMPDKPGRILKCEGYLFPDTYEFFEDDTIANYVKTFYKEFDSKISGLTAAIDADPNDCINSIDDAVILASFIQEEAGKADEDAKVSAVFHNRLESTDPLWSEHRLESNASSYIMNDSDNNYLWNSPLADFEGWKEAGAIPQEVLDAYDTYAISGLPAGAITNPGYDALQAALNPDQEYLKDGYYFFVTGSPSSQYPGQYFYAKTASEHLANCKKAGWA